MYNLCCIPSQAACNKKNNLYSFHTFWLPPFTAGSKYRSADRHLLYAFTMYTSRWHCYLEQLTMTEPTGFLVSTEHAAVDWHIGWQLLSPLLSSIGQSVTPQAALPLDDGWLQLDTRAAFWYLCWVVWLVVSTSMCYQKKQWGESSVHFIDTSDIHNKGPVRAIQ